MDESGTIVPTPVWRRPHWMALPAVLLFLVQAIWFWNFSIDDAGISWRYALHLAQGYGLRWNLAGAPVEGYSNLFWVLLLAACKMFGFGIELAAHLLGLVFGIGSLCLLQLICARLWPHEPYAWLPALLVAATPEWAMWAMSGLEIAMFGALLLLAIWSLLDPERINQSLLSLALCGLVLARPEGAAVGLVILGLWTVLPRAESTWKHRLAVMRRPLFAWAVTCATLALFRLWYYGYPLPNTVYAKFSASLPSWRQVLFWLGHGVPYWVAGLMALRLTRARAQFPLLLISLGVVAIHTALTLPVAPVMNFLHRYHVALLPLLVLAVPAAMATIYRKRRALGIVAAVALVVWSGHGFPAVHRRRSTETACMTAQRCVADRLKTLAGSPSMALIDAGRIPYWTDLPTTDVWGLCDAVIARTGFSPEAILDRHPAAYVISADSTVMGIVEPRLGLDKMMYTRRRFLDGYFIWQYCESSRTAPSENDSYGYAILIELSWAARHGIPLVPHPYMDIEGER